MKSARVCRADDEVVPLTDLERMFGGNRAMRRKFLSNLRRLVKQSKREEMRKASLA